MPDERITEWKGQSSLAVDWDEADNWTDGVPTASHIAQISICTNGDPANVEAEHVEVRELRLDEGARLMATRVDVERLVLQDLGMVVADEIVVRERLQLTGGQLCGPTRIAPGATLVASGAAENWVSGRLVIDGTAVLEGTGQLFLANDGLLNRGRIRVEASTAITGKEMVNQGTIELAGAGITLALDGPTPDAVSGLPLVLRTGSTLALAGGTVVLRWGDSTFEKGARVCSGGLLRLGGGPKAARVTVSGPVSLDPGTTFEVAANGCLYRQAAFVGGGLVHLTGGWVESLTVPKEGQLLVSGDGEKRVDRLVIDGTAALMGPGRLCLYGDGIVNRGRVEVRQSLTIAGSGDIANLGDLVLSDGVEVELAGLSLVSSAMLDLGTATLRIVEQGRCRFQGPSEVIVGVTGCTEPGGFGRILVPGLVTFGGVLTLSPRGYDPDPRDIYPVVRYKYPTQRFTAVRGADGQPWKAYYSDQRLAVTLPQDCFGGLELREDDHDASNGVPARYGGTDRPDLATARYVDLLHRDLSEVGIRLADDDGSTFGRHTRWAVRELQTYGRLAQLARQREPDDAALTAAVNATAHLLQVDTSGGLPTQTPFRVNVDQEVMQVTGVQEVAPRGAELTVRRGIQTTAAASHPVGTVVRLTRWSATLDPVPVDNDERHQGPLAGVLDRETRELLRRWRAKRWRCPVVVEAWTMRENDPDRLAMVNTPDGQGKRPADNLWRHDELKSIKPYVFVRDFCDLYSRPASRPGDGCGDPQMTILGHWTSWPDKDGDRWDGPVAKPKQRQTWRSEGEMLPEHLIGKALSDIASPEELSTYKIVRAVADVEAQGYFDGLNAYDNAFMSLGPCHWTAGNRMRDPKLPRLRWEVEDGELWAYLAYLKDVEPATFQEVLGRFGLDLDRAWETNGDRCYLAGQRKFVARVTAQQADGTFALLTGNPPNYEQLGEYDLLRSWHWFYRFSMAARTIDPFRRRMWDMARLRLRELRDAPWDPPTKPPTIPDISMPGSTTARRARIGDLFCSERSLALIYRWHIFSPESIVKAGRASPDLRKVLARARADNKTSPGLSWAGSPVTWTEEHERVLVKALLNEATSPKTLAQTMADVANWPQVNTKPWLDAGFTLPVDQLPAEERQLRIRRFGFDTEGLPLGFDAEGLPPPPTNRVGDKK